MVTSHPPHGVSCALLTPVTAAGEVDNAGLDNLVGRALAAGVNGLSPTGSTGEGARLSRAQRLAVLRQVVKAGVPVVAGVPAQPIDDTVLELEEIHAAGALAALITPQAYYPPSDAEILAQLKLIADRTPLPLVLYHIPGMAGAGYSPDVVAELATYPGIAGLKDSSRDLEYLRAVVRATEGTGLTIVTGTDTLLIESLGLGAVGTLAASPNVAPELAVGIYQAWSAGDLAKARTLQDRLHDLVRACRLAPFPSGWKHAASAVGACGNEMVPPGLPVTAAAAGAIDRAVGGLLTVAD